MIEISIRNTREGWSYHFKIHEKISILTGDSGTGKTRVAQSVSDQSKSLLGSRLEIACSEKGLKCTLLKDYRNEHSLDLQEFLKNKYVIFVDGNNSFLNYSNVNELIENSPSYFVIIKRHLNKVKVSYKTAYALEVSETRHEAVNLVDFDKDAYAEPDKILVEGTKGSFSFFTKVFKHCSAEIISFGDKSNAANAIQACKGRKVLVIFDGCGIGQTLLMNHKLLMQDNVQCFVEDSPEWRCLTSKLDLNRSFKDIPCESDVMGAKLKILFEKYSKKFPFLINAI
jgi:hypothetical protein